MATSDGRPLAPPFQSALTSVGEAARAGVTANNPSAATSRAPRERFRVMARVPPLARSGGG